VTATISTCPGMLKGPTQDVPCAWPGPGMWCPAHPANPPPCVDCGLNGRCRSLPCGCSCHRDLIAPQPPPTHGEATPTWALVVQDMKARDAMGGAKYGVRHQHDNGRDHLIDLYQELLDGCCYVRAEIERRRAAK
jgi:hypothetical protein